ncbi:MAG: RDD family protein [Desulfobaccales bacterium]
MFCPACGQEAPESANFCQHCGQTLNWAAAGPQIQRTAARRPVPFEYAGFWLRLVALVIDSIFIAIVILGAVTVARVILGVAVHVRLGAGGHGFQAFERGRGLIFLIIMVVPWLYWALMESSSHQATLGKMALGLKVTDLEGEPISFGRATGRYFGKIVSELILYIGFMMAGWTAKKQALHDIMAGTLVVRKGSLPEKLAKAQGFPESGFPLATAVQLPAQQEPGQADKTE